MSGFRSKADILEGLRDVRLTPKADIAERDYHVCFLPKSDICTAAIVPAIIGGNREFSPAVGAG
jgi:hypothetical protein